MAFLHNGDLKPTTVFSFYPCIRDVVYLEGLKEGESILSEHPYFFQNANGYMAIDDRYTSFRITSNDKIIQTMNLKWDNHCVAQTSVVHEDMVNPQYDKSGFGALMVLGIGVLTVLIAWRIFHEHS